MYRILFLRTSEPLIFVSFISGNSLEETEFGKWYFVWSFFFWKIEITEIRKYIYISFQLEIFTFWSLCNKFIKKREKYDLATLVIWKSFVYYIFFVCVFYIYVLLLLTLFSVWSQPFFTWILCLIISISFRCFTLSVMPI